MIPIQDLLNRIRWDPEFGNGNFQLGYYDRVEDRVLLVSLAGVLFSPESPHAFQITNAAGEVHSIPFHRVREVYKDGRRIWHRGDEPG